MIKLQESIKKVMTLMDGFDSVTEIDQLIFRSVYFFDENIESIYKYCTYNMDLVGENLLRRIVDYPNSSENTKAILLLTFYRFIFEHSIILPNYNGLDRDSLCTEIKSYLELYKSDDEFFPKLRFFSLNTMPLLIISSNLDIKNERNAERIDKVEQKMSGYEEFALDVSNISNTIKQWNSTVDSKLVHINSLKSELKNLSSSYNFANISHGFQNILSGKKNSLHLNTFLLVFFAVILVTPPLISIFTESNSVDTAYRRTPEFYEVLTKYAPFLALDFFVLYFCRIVLSSRKEITTQIVQLELRKSLCQFIESYSEKSKELKQDTPELLDKFESLIFSGLTTEPNNLPTTFDGMEQVSNFIKTLKGQ